MSLRALARALLATSGRAVAARAAPLACALAVLAAIVFAPQGLRARDAVALLDGSVWVRAAAWAAWVALATPAASAAFVAPGTVTLRALRPPRAMFAMLVALLAAAQVPWIALFARGAGAARAAEVALLGVALASSASSLRSARGAALFAASAVLVAAWPAASIAIPIAAALAWVAVRHAWRDALEERPTVRLVRRAPAPIALATAYLARMVRSSAARVQAAGGIVLAGGGALALSLRNDPDARPVTRALVVLALPLSVACALLAAPAVETEKRLEPLLRSARVGAGTLFLATALALAAPSSAFAATAGALATSVAPGVPFAAAAWAVPIAAVVAALARRASRARRPSTFVLGVIAIAALFTLLPAAC